MGRTGERFLFQSAPPTEVRGDFTVPGLWNRAAGLFQSAPPTEVRGDAIVAAGSNWVYLFQSAPPTEVRGDHYRFGRIDNHPGFNPLPPPK